MSLKSRVIVRLFLGLVSFVAILFIPAGTLRFWQGWTLILIWSVAAAFSFLYFLKHDPQLIERRLRSKEKIKEQKLLIRMVKPFFLVAFLLPALDYRFGWSRTRFRLLPLVW